MVDDFWLYDDTIEEVKRILEQKRPNEEIIQELLEKAIHVAQAQNIARHREDITGKTIIELIITNEEIRKHAQKHNRLKLITSLPTATRILRPEGPPKHKPSPVIRVPKRRHGR